MKEDQTSAVKLFAKAAAQGHAKARKVLKKLESGE